MRDMPRPWRIRFAGAKYHVTSRGNGREAVFLRPEDHERFLEQLDEGLKADQVVKESFGVSGADLRCHGRRAGLAKAVAVELCCRLTGRTQRAVARHFGYGSESAAGKQRRRVRAKLAEDGGLARRMARIEATVRKDVTKRRAHD